jgi:hypothetical protein
MKVLKDAVEGVAAMSYTMSAIIRSRLEQESNPERREALLDLLALVLPDNDGSKRIQQLRPGGARANASARA